MAAYGRFVLTPRLHKTLTAARLLPSVSFLKWLARTILRLAAGGALLHELLPLAHVCATVNDGTQSTSLLPCDASARCAPHTRHTCADGLHSAPRAVERAQFQRPLKSGFHAKFVLSLLL